MGPIQLVALHLLGQFIRAACPLRACWSCQYTRSSVPGLCENNLFLFQPFSPPSSVPYPPSRSFSAVRTCVRVCACVRACVRVCVRARPRTPPGLQAHQILEPRPAAATRMALGARKTATSILELLGSGLDVRRRWRRPAGGGCR
eukprot:5545093-Pyramimonas_sp.AAC.1